VTPGVEKRDGNVCGDGVNLAERLQALVDPPADVRASQAVRDLGGPKPISRFEDAGECWLKHVAEPVKAWRAMPPGGQPAAAAAAASASACTPLRFGPDGRFELQSLERRLLVDGEPAPLGARAFDLLLELVARPGVLRTKHELIEAVWPGVVVEEGNLATQVSTLRKILGGDVIATIPGRGYRFAAQVTAPGTAPGTAEGASVSSAPPPPAPTASSAPSAPPAVAPPPSAKLQTNLPATLAPLIGRADDLAALLELVEQHRLVSIIGAGGMGKTTAALHLTAARQAAYPHGVCWVELATVTRAEDLPSAIAVALRVQVGNGEPVAALAAALRPLTLLLVLDNAEQVVDGVAHVVQALLSQAPGVRCVVTTQVPLKLAAERAYRIGGLAVPQGPLPAPQALEFGAVALFAERAQAADARWRLTDDNAPAVIEVCRQLDGLALAIELAAARAPMLGVAKLAASMNERLKLLTGGRNRLAPARQQTLRAALEWSHGFLDEAERAVFRRMAVFAGSGSLTMIQQVVADPDGAGELDPWAVLDALALLVDRSLVVAVTADDASEPRYRLLDTPRAYALEQLKAAGEEAVLRRRHLQAMAAWCDAAWHTNYSGDVGWSEWLRTFEREADNAAEAMVHALALGDRVSGLQIGAVRLRAAANLPAAQCIAIAEQCVAQIDANVPPALQVRAGVEVAHALSDMRPLLAEEAVRQALTLAQGSAALRGEPFLRYRALCRFASSVGRRSGVTPEVQAALAEARALEDPRWPPQRRFWRAVAEDRLADRTSLEALRLGREVLAMALASGATGFFSRSNLIDVELANGDAAAAAQAGEALLADLQGGRDEYALAVTRLHLAAAWLMLDRAPRARELAQAGWPQGRLFAMQPYWADHLALLAVLEGRPRAAARLAGYADAAHAAREDRREPNEAAAHARACTLALAALGDAALERLHAEGRLLVEEQIEAIAFGAEDAA